MLKRDGKPKSGRCGEYVYYMRQGRQCWRHYVVPKDPRTARQQLSRKAFSAASRMWSQDGPLTEAERDAWYADGAKRQSRRRLGQSGPLTGQQDYVGRNYAKERRRLEMLLEPRNQEVKNTSSIRHVKLRPSRRRYNLVLFLAGHTCSGRLLWLGDFGQREHGGRLCRAAPARGE